MTLFPIYYYLILFGCGFLMSLIFTPIVRMIAIKSGQTAVPKDNRWHKKETALLGGVAVFMPTFCLWLAGAILLGLDDFGLPYLPVMACTLGMFIVGLIDDLFNMDPQHKLAAQIVIASLLMIFGFRLDWTAFKTANLFISIVWIVGITNAFNLLDNMDGLSVGIALVAGIFLFIMNFLNTSIGASGAALLFLISGYLGAMAGFLMYNFNPASIFMGDAGSLFIGFYMACMTIIGSSGEKVSGSAGHLISVIAIPILIVFIPILDTGFVSLMRKLFRRPISKGGKDHSSHRMVAIGLSEKKAVLILYGFAIFSGFIALAINYLSVGATLVIVVLYLLFVVLFWVYLARVKVYQEDSIFADGGSGAITPILVQLTYRRRLFEVFLDFILITLAYYLAYLLRFEGPVYYLIGDDFSMFLKSLPIVVACQILCFFVLGVYRGIWETTGLSDLIDYIKAITAGTILSILVILAIYRFHGFSRTVFIVYWVLLLVMVSLSRLSFRLVEEGVKRGRQSGRCTLIYGAGAGGQMIVKEIENNLDLNLSLVGFIDDNPRKYKKKIRGYPVLGSANELERLLKENKIEEIIISFKKNGIERKRELKKLCMKMGHEIDVKQMRMVLE